jgi:hypothetical protein
MIAIEEVVVTVEPEEQASPSGTSSRAAPTSRQTARRRLRSELGVTYRNQRRLAAT